jgi:hypothetical protein
MPERELFAERVLGVNKLPRGKDEPRAAAVGERQPTAQAFTLTVAFKDGRRARGFAMSHYSDYEWTDEGEAEKLVILFGDRALTVEGELLEGVVSLLQEGRLTHLQEMTHREVQSLKQHNPDRKPIVTRATVEPDLQLILGAIRGEEGDETRYPRRVK